MSPLRAAIGTPAEDYIDGSKPFMVIWKLGTKKEIAEVRRKGSLPFMGAEDFNYFFTKCKSAMQLRGLLLDQGSPAEFGLMKFRISHEGIKDSGPHLAGIGVKFAGGKDRHAVMAQKGVSRAFMVPDVIRMIKGAGKCF